MAARQAVLCLLALLPLTACMQDRSDTRLRTTAPYGAWASPLTAARVTAGALRFGDLMVDGGDLYWTEGRASEGGRYVVVRRTADDRTLDVTPCLLYTSPSPRDS